MINKIKDRLRDNWDELENILHKLGFYKIHRESNKYIKWGYDKDSSGNANWIKPSTLSCTCSNHNIKGDILVLVAKRKFNGDSGEAIGKAIGWLGKELGLKNNYKPIEVKLPFNGFWKNLNTINKHDLTPPLTYPISRYTQYAPCCSKLWIEDNISCLTQEKFDIRYNDLDNRILLPWTWFGELAGIVGRLNIKNMTKTQKKYKYLSEIPFVKEKVVFGYDINYKNLLEQGFGFVFESEKATMQCHSMGFYNAVSIGSSYISDQQSKLLKGLYIDWIICLDSDHTYEECVTEAKKLKINNPFFHNNVYVIYDKEQKYMKTEDKVCPTDLGDEVFVKILKECEYKID